MEFKESTRIWKPNSFSSIFRCHGRRSTRIDCFDIKRSTYYAGKHEKEEEAQMFKNVLINALIFQHDLDYVQETFNELFKNIHTTFNNDKPDPS